VNILVSILGLAFLILVHEAGHFLVARAVGMNPRKFYIGFPPALVKRVRNGIEYGIGTIPLGGYVKIPGMHRPAPADVDDGLAVALGELPGLHWHIEEAKQALAAEDYPAARAALAAARAQVEGAGLSAAALKSADRALTDLDDACAPDAYWRARTWKRVAVILAGPGANFIVAIALFWVVFTVAYGPSSNTIATVGTTVTVAGKEVPAPAAQAGIRAGDKVLSLGGTPTPDGATLIDVITASGGKPLAVVVERDGKRVELPPVTPALTQYTGEAEPRYRLGFSPDDTGYPTGEAGWRAVKAIGYVSRDTVKSLGNLVNAEGRDQVSSPVGIVRESARAADAGWESYLTLLAFISLSLGLLNLLPLLPLDGGHIMVSLLEGIRRKPFRKEVYLRFSTIGIALVLLLFFIGLTNDLGGRTG
jgi:regulator of sigma E protease